MSIIKGNGGGEVKVAKRKTQLSRWAHLLIPICFHFITDVVRQVFESPI